METWGHDTQNAHLYNMLALNRHVRSQFQMRSFYWCWVDAERDLQTCHLLSVIIPCLWRAATVTLSFDALWGMHCSLLVPSGQSRVTSWVANCSLLQVILLCSLTLGFFQVPQLGSWGVPVIPAQLVLLDHLAQVVRCSHCKASSSFGLTQNTQLTESFTEWTRTGFPSVMHNVFRFQGCFSDIAPLFLRWEVQNAIAWLLS